MQLIDSHAHIYLEHFNSDLLETIDRAREEGVETIYMPNIDHTSIDDMLQVSDDYPELCIPMMGLHPTSVKKDFEKELYLVEEWLDKGSFAAVGEIGTDLYWDKAFWTEQQEALKVQLDLAKKHKLPFVIHCRDSIDETIELIKSLNSDKLTGVFHCFTGTVEQAKDVTSMGFKIGIGGVATFKNGGLEDVISETDLENILLETDSPYLAPVPYRGKRNEPSYINYVCEKVATVKNLDKEVVGRITSANTRKLFKPIN